MRPQQTSMGSRWDNYVCHVCALYIYMYNIYIYIYIYSKVLYFGPTRIPKEENMSNSSATRVLEAGFDAASQKYPCKVLVMLCMGVC
jgi:hypothetical protein